MSPILSRTGGGGGGSFGFGRRKTSGKITTATGGTVSNPGDGYTYHTFISPNDSPSTQTFDVFVPITIEVLVQGGGGNGSAGDFTPNPSQPSGAQNRAGGSGGAGGSTGVWTIPISTGTYPVVAGGTASSSSLNSPPSSFSISAGGGGSAPSSGPPANWPIGGTGASNSTNWTGSTLTANYPSGAGPSNGPPNGPSGGLDTSLFINDSGRPGGNAGGVPASPTLWWRPHVGSGGAGGDGFINNVPYPAGIPGIPGNIYGGGGGGGQGSNTTPSEAGPGGLGTGAKGIVIIRYLA